jgi:hypothetical protein
MRGENDQRTADLVGEQRAALAAQVALHAATDQLIAKEHELTAGQAEAETRFESMKGERDAALKKALAVSRTAAGRLYVDAACPAPGPAGVPQTPADPGSPPPAPAGKIELAQPDADFLLAFASGCDEITDRLRLAVETLRNDRHE